MKNLLIIFCLLLSTGLVAQIDGLEDFELTSDTTIQAKPDTAFWRFFSDTLYRQLPNGNMRPIPVYQADLVVWQNGQRRVNRSSGIMTWRDIVQYGRTEINARNNEIQLIRQALDGVVLFRNQWRDFLLEERGNRNE